MCKALLGQLATLCRYFPCWLLTTAYTNVAKGYKLHIEDLCTLCPSELFYFIYNHGQTYLLINTVRRIFSKLGYISTTKLICLQSWIQNLILKFFSIIHWLCQIHLFLIKSSIHFQKCLLILKPAPYLKLPFRLMIFEFGNHFPPTCIRQTDQNVNDFQANFLMKYS